MAHSNFLALILSLITYFSYTSYGNEVQHETIINLKTGESINISTKKDMNLQINRKGIITAQILKNGLWRITALKKGLAIIKSAKKRWLVHVKTSSPQNRKLNIPDWICRDKLVHCQFESKTITGEFSSYINFLQAREWCDKNKPCMFFSKLNSEGKNNLQQFISEQLGPKYLVESSLSGHSRVHSPCKVINKENIKKNRLRVEEILTSSINKNLLEVNCIDSIDERNYLLYGKIILISSQSAEKLGFNSRSPLGFNLNKKLIYFQSLGEFQAQLKNMKASLIGEPFLKLKKGVKAKAQSGGEFPILTSNPNKDESQQQQWKSYGLSLSVEINPINSERVNLKYQFNLSEPVQSRVNTNELKSELIFTLNKAKLAGVIELSSDRSQDNKHSIFSKTPLISPFFSSKTNQDAKSKVLLWLNIEEE